MTTYPASHCPYCGTELGRRRVDGRERQFCEACDRVIWRNPAPAAGVAVLDDSGVLLAERAVEPGVGEWTVPGGHLELEESPREGAARELREETGVVADPDDLALLDTFSAELFGDDGTGKHVVSIGFAVRRERTEGGPSPGTEVADVGWFTPGELEGTDVTVHPPHGRRVRRAWAALGDE